MKIYLKYVLKDEQFGGSHSTQGCMRMIAEELGYVVSLDYSMFCLELEKLSKEDILLLRKGYE